MAKKTKPAARRAFASRLKAARISAGYDTARGFAEALGVEENRYTRWERAETEPDLEMLLRICQLLDTTPNHLILGRVEKASDGGGDKKTSPHTGSTQPLSQNG